MNEKKLNLKLATAGALCKVFCVTGSYHNRNQKTPPPEQEISIVENIIRSNTAPPAIEGEENVEFFLSSSSTVSSNHHQLASEKKSSDSFSDYKKLDTTNNSVKIDDDKFSTTATAHQNNFFTTADGKVRCEICSKEFSKIGLLRLHMDVHRLAQSSKRYDYRCPLCNSCFRSKSVLQKHLTHAHPRDDDDLGNNEEESSSKIIKRTTISCSTPSLTSVVCSTTVVSNISSNNFVQQLSPTTSKPRPFECTDCCIAFRIHGHLAKHLRSKSHIMKLESLEKVPIGIFAKLEENNEYFTEIDTSDCRNSLKSLLTLVNRLMYNQNTITSSKNNTTTNEVLTQKESFVRISSPTKSFNVKDSSDAEIKANKMEKCVKTSTAQVSQQDSLTNNKSSVIRADLWVPPKSVDVDDDKKLLTTCSNQQQQQRPANNNKLIPSPVDIGENKKSAEEKNNNNVYDNSTSTTSTTNTRCNLCCVDFYSSTELELHWHADHVLMRDGKYLKCPRAGCDAVYPNKQSLRLHLSAHFYGRLDYGINNSVVESATTNNLVNNKKLINNYSNNKIINAGRSKVGVNKLFRESSSGSTDYSPVSESDSNQTSRSPTPNTVDEITTTQDDFVCKLKCLKRKLSDDAIASLTPPSAKFQAVLNETVKEIETAVLRPTVTTIVNEPTAASLKFQDIFPDQSSISSLPFAHQRLTTSAGIWNPFNCSPISPQSLYLAAAAAGNPFALMNLNNHHQNVKMLANNNNSYHHWGQSNNFAQTSYPPLNHHHHPQLVGGGLSSAFYRGGVGGAGSHNNNILSSNGVVEPSPLSSLFLADELRCIVCKKQCSTPMSLQEHVMSHNLESRLHVCKFCDAGFTTAQALHAHLPCRHELKVSYYKNAVLL